MCCLIGTIAVLIFVLMVVLYMQLLPFILIAFIIYLPFKLIKTLIKK